MVIFDILLTIAIDKSNSTWYDVLFKIADSLRWRTGTLKKDTEMKILVVEDNPRHRQAAYEQLMGHDLTVVGTYGAAKQALEWAHYRVQFDVVLTDTEIPSEGFFGEIAPVNALGSLIVLMALNEGIKLVALVTLSTHDHEPDARHTASAHWTWPFQIAGTRVLFMADNMTKVRGKKVEYGQYVKNWAAALDCLIS